MPCRCVPAVDITLYRTSTLAEGLQAQAYFLRKGVAFNDLDISADQQARQEMIDLSGQMERPVITVNGRVFIGFNPVDLELVVPSLF